MLRAMKERNMSLGDAILFGYEVLASALFTFALLYLCIIGARQLLADIRAGRAQRAADLLVVGNRSGKEAESYADKIFGVAIK